MRRPSQNFGWIAPFSKRHLLSAHWGQALAMFWRLGDNQDPASSHSCLGPGQDPVDTTMCYVLGATERQAQGIWGVA